MKKRVVITGLGVVAPNGVGIEEFEKSLRQGKSGIRQIPDMKEYNFSCQVGGEPNIDHLDMSEYFTPLEIKMLKSKAIIFGAISATQAYRDAGLKVNTEEPDWDMGCVFGTGGGSIELLRDCIYVIDDHRVKRLGSTMVQQTMGSGISAHIGGAFGLGNHIFTNSSACCTGSEAIIIGAERIRSGQAKRMIVGSCDTSGVYAWAGFDAMRVLNRKHNDEPEKASRPMSATSSGFVAGSGAGSLVLEEYDSAVARGAKIYAEVLGTQINSGGHLQGGTMTAPNPTGVGRCIKGAIKDAGIQASEIDAISGHLTSTMADVVEVQNWSKFLDRKGKDFPYIHSMKSMIGHCLGAAGSIECVGVALQLKNDFFHASLNCEDLHPEIAATIDKEKVPNSCLVSTKFNTIAKSSFGFGDVNSCIIFRKVTI